MMKKYIDADVDDTLPISAENRIINDGYKAALRAVYKYCRKCEDIYCRRSKDDEIDPDRRLIFKGKMYAMADILEEFCESRLKDENLQKDEPTSDVQEVKHSHWTQVSVTDYQFADGNNISIASMFCPNCKRWNNRVYLYGNPTEHVNYCSFCGAKMDGEENENDNEEIY